MYCWCGRTTDCVGPPPSPPPHAVGLVCGGSAVSRILVSSELVLANLDVNFALIGVVVGPMHFWAYKEFGWASWGSLARGAGTPCPFCCASEGGLVR